ncbi:MAG: hypothetical protein RRC07_00745 [Anaerolineae bacterium]|nr:hypothetical protein [Anaerolineae bacterium]
MNTVATLPPATAHRRHVPRHSQLLRWAGASLASLVLRCRLVDEEGGWVRAESLLSQGYGLIALMNHFSVRDAPQALALLARSRVMRRQPYIAPAASHQLAANEGLVRFFTALFAIELCPVITPFRGSGSANPGEIRANNDAYRSRTAAVLQEGGIMLLAPQARRSPQLGTPRGRPVGKLLEHFSPGGENRVALLFIGFGIPGVSDYAREQVGGLNLAMRYEARIGATVTVAEALQAQPDVDEIDNWVFAQLRTVVPPGYGG